MPTNWPKLLVIFLPFFLPLNITVYITHYISSPVFDHYYCSLNLNIIQSDILVLDSKGKMQEERSKKIIASLEGMI